ncbi:Asp23/Gls24 family envelope stress response protein [Pseudonocardia sp. KRD291]|uniref:Asp23/Gls24 family envelope stress response protein n=1 Tax=Pseudonocardia sp. KRD291 TaxID=2792007 RepID=UPI001C4A0495|nr:Asp23/Gls24 family envelope stress response protein [Pseudonocardia sp. KRD291]MBW0102895.1 Asp23/Gls24 family envelope stress response protein [Pseudonocardia sp. KRD291]
MSADAATVVIPRTPPPGHAGEAGRHRADDATATACAESRGTLEVADQVVEKIAATALGEIDELGGAAPRMLGVPVGSGHPDRSPRVEATVHGRVVDLDVRATVTYPAPIARTADRARAHVSARVGELTDLTVRGVDITVSALATEPASKGRGLT